MRVPSEDSPHAAALRPSQRPPHELPVAGGLGGEPISGASRRLRALAALSGSLTDSLGLEDAANLVEQQALSALGATSAVVVTLGTFPPATSLSTGAYAPPVAAMLNVVHAIGLPAEIKAVLDQLPLDAPVPLAEVARAGEPLFLPSEQELRRYPAWGEAMIRQARARRRSCPCGRMVSCAASSVSPGLLRASSTRMSARSCSRSA
jgi:hypothetical protein